MASTESCIPTACMIQAKAQLHMRYPLPIMRLSAGTCPPTICACHQSAFSASSKAWSLLRSVGNSSMATYRVCSPSRLLQVMTSIFLPDADASGPCCIKGGRLSHEVLMLELPQAKDQGLSS